VTAGSSIHRCKAPPLILRAIPKPVRIAQIITRLGLGGAERHVCSLTANLNREKFESWLIAGRSEKSEREWVEFAAEAAVEPVFINQLRRKLKVRAVLFGSISPSCVIRRTTAAGYVRAWRCPTRP
jgi:hypothetical protein